MNLFAWINCFFVQPERKSDKNRDVAILIFKGLYEVHGVFKAAIFLYHVGFLN